MKNSPNALVYFIIWIVRMKAAKNENAWLYVCANCVGRWRWRDGFDVGDIDNDGILAYSLISIKTDTMDTHSINDIITIINRKRAQIQPQHLTLHNFRFAALVSFHEIIALPRVANGKCKDFCIFVCLYVRVSSLRYCLVKSGIYL